MCTTLLTPTHSVFRTVSTPASRIPSMFTCSPTTLAITSSNCWLSLLSGSTPSTLLAASAEEITSHVSTM